MAETQFVALKGRLCISSGGEKEGGLERVSQGKQGHCLLQQSRHGLELCVTMKRKTADEQGSFEALRFN